MNSTDEDVRDQLPSKLDLASQLMSVDRILEQTIEKVKITLLMPRIIEESKIAVGRLIKTEFKFCADILLSYKREKRLKGETLQHNGCLAYEDPKLIQLIDIFQENHKIVKYFTDWLAELCKDEKESIIEFVMLKSIAKERFHVKAIKQLEEEKELGCLYTEYQNNLKYITVLDKIESENRVQTRWRSLARRSTIQDLTTKVNEDNIELKAIRDKARDECINRLKAAEKNHIERKKRVQEELEIAKQDLQKSMKNNLIEENTSRNEHNKWMIQLQNLIKRYDQQMGDKLREKIYLEQQYDDALADHLKFVKKVYAPAERRYNSIVRAKRLVEDQKWLEKVTNFIMNRAARVIQRAYRNYLRINNPEIVAKPAKGKGKGKGKDKDKDKDKDKGKGKGKGKG